jgi:O-antigen/teichoic acid export membrane protein
LLQDIKNTIKQSAIYGLSRISFKFIGFILFPLYSLYFTPKEYGIIVRGEIFWPALQTIMLYALETAIFRWYSLLDDIHKKKSLIFSAYSLLIILNLILVVISFIFSSQISKILFNTDAFPDIIRSCILITLFETLLGVPLIILRIEEKAVKYSVLVILESLISLSLQIYFITSTTQKLNGVFIAKVIAAFTIFIILLPKLLRAISFHFDLSLIKQILIFCLPLMAASLVSNLFNSQDRFILGYITDSNQVGLYGLGYNIAGVLVFLLISPFALAFPTIFWKKTKEDNAERFFTKSVTYSFLAYTSGALILSLIAPDFIRIFARNPDYWLAMDIVPIISFSLAIYGIQVIGFMSFYYYKKTHVVLLILLISTIINFILNLILIPFFQMYGAAISTFISYILSSVIIYIWSKKYYFIKWEIYKLSISLIVGIILVLPFYLMKLDNIIISIVLRIIAIIIYPLILYYLHFYENIEIETIKKFIYKYIHIDRKPKIQNY